MIRLCTLGGGEIEDDIHIGAVEQLFLGDGAAAVEFFFGFGALFDNIIAADDLHVAEAGCSFEIGVGNHTASDHTDTGFFHFVHLEFED